MSISRAECLRRRLSSSTWTRAQRDPVIALSTQSSIGPMDGRRPEVRAR
ncbi:hypothetical protein ABTY20_32635 [Streptomyces sp. NPDC126497]